MSSPDKRPSLESLPDDLLLSCIARVSRLYYLTLSLVSKRFRSLLVSPELYKVRSLLNHTESCLYVYFEFNRSWYILCRKPDRTLTNDNDTKSSGFVLAKLPAPYSRHPRYASLVTVGSNIYHIGGYIDVGVTSSRVSIMDCRSHTWHEGPKMQKELITYCASVVGQKIYVVGINKDSESSLEALDTNNQTWDRVSVPISLNRRNLDIRAKSVCLDGKFHLVTAFKEDVVSYDSKEGRWDPVGPEISQYMHLGSHCEIENVLYTVGLGGEFKWYDTKVRMWSDLMGLEGLPKLSPYACVSLADYGGKMAVLWVDNLFDLPVEEYTNKVWCAEITLERRKCGEIWGRVDWFDNVLTIPEHCHYDLKILAATI